MKCKKDSFDIESINNLSFISILLSSKNDTSSSSDKAIQLIEYQMCSLKKKWKKFFFYKEKESYFDEKRLICQESLTRSEMKSSTKHDSSSIEWNTCSENSKTSNTSIVEQSNKVQNPWNNAYSTKASRCSWIEVQTTNPFMDHGSVWRKKDSLNELSKKVLLQVLHIQITQIVIYPIHILHLIDGILFLGVIIVQIKRFKINQDTLLYLMNSPTINIVHITKIHLFHMIHQENQLTNKTNSSNKNKIDYRKQEPNNTCHIQPSQQQNRNCLQIKMRIGPTHF